MKKTSLESDPYAAREAAKYDNPIPSREYIISFLRERGKPMTHKQLARSLDVADDAERLDALGRRLNAMERDGQLAQNRRGKYGLIDKMNLAKGRVISHRDGFGFVVLDDGGDDWYLSPREMRRVFNGDRVLVRQKSEDHRGRREAAIVEVLEHKTKQVVGRIAIEGGVAYVEPANKKLHKTILITADGHGGARDGQIVLVEVIAQPSMRSQPLGHVVEVLGDHMGPGMEIEIALHSYEVPDQWSQAVLEEAEQFANEIPEASLKGRKDLRELPLVTIDGEDAKDFDDAVYCEERSKGGWQLYVAIADVSHYVQSDSALDNEAANRGNSVYFPGRVVPMLPEVLSNGLCSLKPKVDRLCMVCEMSIALDGKVERFRFYEAVMHSHARLTYDKVAAMIDGDARVIKKYEDLWPHIKRLHDLYRCLHKRRTRRGAIEFDTTETCFIFNDDKKIEKIVPVVRNDAHRLIEECMLAANVSTAKYLSQHDMPFLYRVHARPQEEKVNDLRDFLNGLGLALNGGKEPKPRDYTKLLQEISERPDKKLIQTVLLRSLSQAVYTPDNLGHFGLAYKEYTHFTSPIRRYPDLLVHRAIRYVLSRQPVNEFQYGEADMLNYGEHCSMTERRADEATRDATEWLKCEYMMDKVGREYSGRITGVTNFGIFVELEGVFVEGLVHVTSLPNDYYRFEPTRHCLVGERSNKRYQIGDTVNVMVARVDLDERQIDFELIQHE